jgi:hypothetical protein
MAPISLNWISALPTSVVESQMRAPRLPEGVVLMRSYLLPLAPIHEQLQKHFFLTRYYFFLSVPKTAEVSILQYSATPGA